MPTYHSAAEHISEPWSVAHAPLLPRSKRLDVCGRAREIFRGAMSKPMSLGALHFVPEARWRIYSVYTYIYTYTHIYIADICIYTYIYI